MRRIRILMIVLAAGSFAACASSGVVHVPQPFPMPGKPGTVTAPVTADPAAGPVTAAPGDPNAVPPPGSPALPAPVVPGRGTADGYALAGTALALRGAPYRNGGSDPSGFDCSGFTQYVFAQYGIGLPRDVRAQYQMGKSVRPEELAAGDVVFFATTDPGPSHVAIAIGGDEFVHAPSSTGVVRVERLSSSYWAPRYLGARRAV